MDLLFSKLHLDISSDEEAIFCLAMTHRSAANERLHAEAHNERLEFLGDAVLELITTDYLYHKFGDPEGVLTSLRSALVKGDHLAQVARKVGLPEYLIMSKGEARSGGAEKDYILANAVEAFIGALYLTKGLPAAATFIEKYILCDLDDIIRREDHIDAKSAFQELAQAQISITPHYEVIDESGLDHEKIFTVAAFLEDKKVGQGTGNSKKEAQSNAAEDALKNKDVWLKSA